MIQQGDILLINLDPVAGHEQGGRRPMLVVSNGLLNQTGMAMVCPITRATKEFPTRIPIATERTTGAILTDQIRTVDLNARNALFIDRCPADVLQDAVETVKEML